MSGYDITTLSSSDREFIDNSIAERINHGYEVVRDVTLVSLYEGGPDCYLVRLVRRF